MGRPLRKLHQAHFCLSVRLGYLQYPHHGFGSTPDVSQHREQGFVSKKDRREKADRKLALQVSGNIIPYLPRRHKESL
jgi:hypothetical protein